MNSLRHRRPWLALTLALVGPVLLAPGCGGGDAAQDSRAVVTLPPPEETTPTTTDTPEDESSFTASSTTTTTTDATTTLRPTIEPSARATSLAALLDAGVEYLVDTLDAVDAADPLQASIEAAELAATRYAAVAADGETAAVRDDLVAGAQDSGALYTRYLPLLRDPATAQAAIAEFLVENTALIETGGEVDTRMTRLVIDELGITGGPVGAYFAATTALSENPLAEAGELVGALQVLATDPSAEAARTSLVQTSALLLEAGDRLAAVEPPAALEVYHTTMLDSLVGFGEVAAEIGERLAEGRGILRSQAVLIDHYSERVVALSAERTRLLIAALRGEIY